MNPGLRKHLRVEAGHSLGKWYTVACLTHCAILDQSPSPASSQVQKRANTHVGPLLRDPIVGVGGRGGCPKISMA